MSAHRCKWMALNWWQQKLPFSLLSQNESICQSQSISFPRVGTPCSAPASCVYLESVYEKRSCIPAWKENKKLPRGWSTTGRWGKDSTHCGKGAKHSGVNSVCEDCDNVCIQTTNKRRHARELNPPKPITASGNNLCNLVHFSDISANWLKVNIL